MMQTDVKATTGLAGATTVVFEGRARFKSATISYTTGGNVTINNGTTAIWQFVPQAGSGSFHVLLPGEGILATSNLTVTCSANATATVTYG
jgi:hypothetical protein